MKRVILIAALALLAFPATANAASVRGYRIWDAGGVIKERWVLCVYPAPGIEWKVYDRTKVEYEDGSDPHTYVDSDWFSRGCTRVTTSTKDRLRYEGWYYARLRVRIGYTGEIIYTPWRSFWSR
jgi:hypothetical protein